ncbi:hypothetical protein NDU88_013065 [Pleurodeles waltl]|uniref:Uncharacterized protein n=1 Tax=Pleurodeles waltl TaxID=8319 RepID=A0AAV7R2L6_PLEWA|nr:hypothetical protein NDU88_013025 [Pleurodeles waltl]KAJ1146806.1 hypothetical protein NDU88_013065 [Pleurodeles waltl]
MKTNRRSARGACTQSQLPGQEQAASVFGRFKREDPELDGGDREDYRSKEPRSVTGDERGDLTTEEYPEDLHAELEALEGQRGHHGCAHNCKKGKGGECGAGKSKQSPITKPSV